VAAKVAVYRLPVIAIGLDDRPEIRRVPRTDRPPTADLARHTNKLGPAARIVTQKTVAEHQNSRRLEAPKKTIDFRP
jgi:hypothetical protein